MKLKYWFTIVKLAFIIFLPITLVFLPKDAFDSGATICLSKLFFDVECYGCGMTRACMHLIHFDFEEAFAYNAISFIAFPALCIVWAQWFLKEYKRFKAFRSHFSNQF